MLDLFKRGIYAVRAGTRRRHLTTRLTQDLKQAPGTKTILPYFRPVAANPYQSMLYSRAGAHDVLPFPVYETRDLRQLDRVIPSSFHRAMHYHWLHRIFIDAKTAAQAGKAASRFVRIVHRQQDAGFRIIWTVHNILSHETRFPDEEIWLRRQMAAISDTVHIMNPQTQALCGEFYHLDETRLLSAPHPSYTGVYANTVDTLSARQRLGLTPADTVLLAFGGLGPYKGLRHFLGIWPEIKKAIGGSVKLIIAGKARDKAFLSEIKTYMDDDVLLYSHHIDDSEVQTYFNAADVVVCPYVRTLNSGVIMTAATFGKPVVVPQYLAGIFTGVSGACHAFDPVDFRSILPCLQQALAASGEPEITAAIQTWAEERSAALVSDRFFHELTGLDI